MSWAAANAPKVAGVRPEDVSATTKKRSTETVEAALSRLSRAYTSVMECIGSLHKTDGMLQKDPSKVSEDTLAVLERVANAARTTLEKAILLDPLILSHAPTVNDAMFRFLEREEDGGPTSRWKIVTEPRAEPPVLTSAAHKTTVRELAYLSLVNYSDLLLMCSVGGEEDTTISKTMLNRGVVAKLQTLQAQKRCCWKEETREDAQRLAVTALCDASKLDGSDPTIWLKLACASRGLENILSLSALGRNKHRRLQRLALERGSQALTPRLPPNRAVQRALKELLEEPEPEFYESPPDENFSGTVELVLDLPRYSWSVLGRMLLRVTREGTDFGNDRKHRHNHGSLGKRQSRNIAAAFGSPLIQMNISPVLVLPIRVLGRICHFLDNSAIWRFEATCRAMSVSIMSARAVMEDEEHQQKEKKKETLVADSLIKRVDDDIMEDACIGNARAVIKKKTKDADANDRGNTRSLRENSRSSQRLRSQQITSGKKTERLGKRKSFEYCFLAATSGNVAEYHNAAVNDARADEAILQILPERGSPKKFRIDQQTERVASGRKRVPSAPTGDSSLAAFVGKWSGRNSGPMDLVSKYLGHVAMNVSDVFLSDSSGTVALTSCLLSCFEALITRSGYHEGFSPRFYKNPEESGSFTESLEFLSLDLLHAELMLKQCDRYRLSYVAYDDENNMIGVLIPQIYEAYMELDMLFLKNEQTLDKDICHRFAILKIRANWLIAGFYLWRSGIAASVREAQEAEDEGTSFIQEALKSFQSVYIQHKTLPTPHLVSPGRPEVYWREISPASLRKYRDEIQASSIVSIVKEKFHALVASLNERIRSKASDALTDEDTKTLRDIGARLYERYRPGGTSEESKVGELIEDFLSIHGNYVESAGDDKFKQPDGGNIESLIPLEQVEGSLLQNMTNPSILTILVVSMLTESSNRTSVQKLLVRLVIETRRKHKDLLQRIAEARASRRFSTEDDEFSDSDDDSVMSGDKVTSKNMDERRAVQCGHLIACLVDRIRQYLSKDTTGDQCQIFARSDELSAIMQTVLGMSLDWFVNTTKCFAPEDIADLYMVRSIGSLLAYLNRPQLLTRNERRDLDQQYTAALSRILIKHRYIFFGLVKNHGDRSSRAAKQKLCAKRAEFAGLVSTEISLVLSNNLATDTDLVLSPSCVLAEQNSSLEGITRGLSAEELRYLIDATLWLWKFSSQSLSENDTAEVSICSSFDRPLVKILRIPTGALVVGICGSAAGSRTTTLSTGSSGDPLCLSEFYDTDESANEWLSDDDGISDRDRKLKEMLRITCHSVQCIDLVLHYIDDKGALSLEPSDRCFGLGPLLPLVASRVLNLFADFLLGNFIDEERDEPDLWAARYPITTRTIGEILDSNLHKVYRWMYGFALVSEKSHTLHSGKDLASSIAPSNDLAVKTYRLEDISAAARLYRCIVRAYDTGRRSPPKKSLEFVSNALPAVEANEKSKIIRCFVFDASTLTSSMEQVKAVTTEASGWDGLFLPIKTHLTTNHDELSFSSNGNSEKATVMRIRRGIISQLADGLLPMSTNESTKGKSDQVQDDDRTITIKNEEEITKKFEAIFDDICLGDARSSESWHRAAQCLSAKAELIADRLGLSKGFLRATKFTIPDTYHRNVQGISLSSLHLSEDEEENLINSNWVHHLGDDLSAYTKHTWSSLDSLRKCADAIGKSCNADGPAGENAEGVQSHQRAVWKTIDSFHGKGDILAWQEAWGGMFVFTLRKIAVRFLLIALYLLRSKDIPTSDDKVLMSELCESLGVLFYSDLICSQNYGYPMRVMGIKRKRELATTAKICFEASVEFVNEPEKTNDGNEEVHTTWDLIFMLGKCEEKIAGTYKKQSFPDTSEATYPGKSRLYEEHIRSALNHYAAALAQVKAIEDDGGAIVNQSGGSAHGRTEIEYRILAVRLKCLIASAVRVEKEFDRAELEALRLTECHWSRTPEDIDAQKLKPVRDRIWTVFADIVYGLAQCRVDQPFFHRSVYRHTQALMWAPVLHDPTSGEGSLGSVPATKSFLIRGMNSSTVAAESAETVICSLFDKKRSQLCAVWVTPLSNSSPFQVINTSTRKYDSLRGKYISAYIACLRLSHRRAKLETFLKWLASTPRDVASYFQASARAMGAAPPKSHMNEPLLLMEKSLSEHSFTTSVKRQANNAFASALMYDMEHRKRKQDPVDEKKQAETDLKFAYATYLRLNCSKEDLDKIRAWRYSKEPIREVEALIEAFMGLGGDESTNIGSPRGKASFGDWTGGGRKVAIFERALSKSKELFPTLSPNFFSKKATASSKAKRGATDDSDDPTRESNKRKDPPAGSSSMSAPGTESAADGAAQEMVTKSYEVTVPAGLSPGQSFLTTINIGGQKKQFRLTVPDGGPSTLRFKTQVPKSPDSSTTKKPRIEDS